jgi:hypothetical protein
MEEVQGADLTGAELIVIDRLVVPAAAAVLGADVGQDLVEGLLALPYGVLVGVLLCLDLRSRKDSLTLERLRTDLQASAA